MNWKTVIISVSIGSLLFYSGCQQSLSPTNYEESPETDISNKKSVGVKLENPYTVETMLRAHNNLKTQGMISGNLTDGDFKPTHYYIRFKPETEEEYIEINRNSGLVLWDFPLDYEFPEGTVKYRDPEIPGDKPNYLYTTVKVNQDIISDNYEILAELILLPEEEEGVQVKRSDSYNSDLFDNYDLLEYEALRITGNFPESPKRGKKWRPKGSVKVFDEEYGDHVKVVSVNIRTRNWFRWWDGYTDRNGKFRCPKEYYGKVSYSLRWQYPHNRFDIRSGDRVQAYFIGSNQKGDWNCKIRSGREWMHAHIFRAGSFYVGQEPFGLKNRPFDYISIRALDKNSPSDHISGYKIQNSDVYIYRNNRSGKRHTSRELFYFTSHELGHAHHHEIYDGYKLKGVSNRLKEAWACAIGYFMTSKNYRFPLNDRDLKNYTIQLWYSWGWTNSNNSPLIIDLIDNYNQKWLDRYCLDDPISGYTLKQMESIVAKKGCKTVNDFIREVKALRKPRGVTSSMLNRYFSQYK